MRKFTITWISIKIWFMRKYSNNDNYLLSIFNSKSNATTFCAGKIACIKDILWSKVLILDSVLADILKKNKPLNYIFIFKHIPHLKKSTLPWFRSNLLVFRRLMHTTIKPILLNILRFKMGYYSENFGFWFTIWSILPYCQINLTKFDIWYNAIYA